MIDAAETTYVVADSDKFGRTSFASLGALSLIHYIVTDSDIDMRYQEDFKAQDIEIIIA